MALLSYLSSGLPGAGLLSGLIGVFGLVGMSYSQQLPLLFLLGWGPRTSLEVLGTGEGQGQGKEESKTATFSRNPWTSPVQCYGLLNGRPVRTGPVWELSFPSEANLLEDIAVTEILSQVTHLRDPESPGPCSEKDFHTFGPPLFSMLG